MRTFVLVVTLVLLTAFLPVASAQSVKDNVSVSAGVVRPTEGNVVAAGAFEVQKTLGTEQFLFDNTLILSDNVGNSTGQHIANTALVRGYIGKNFFVAGGASFGSAVNTGLNEDMFLNPTVQTGVTFEVGQRLQFEPYVQLDTPDVLSNNPTRALTANLTTKVAVNESYGFIFDTGISQVRADNRFLKSGGQNVPFALGGMYFRF